MGSSRAGAALVLALCLAVAGAAAGAAWSHGLWLSLVGASLIAGWMAGLVVLAVRGAPPIPSPVATDAEREAVAQRMLLDASPTPLLLVDDAMVRTLNRAARGLFDTDDRVLPPPSALFDPDVSHLRHAGRSWRADRVDLGARSVVALIDVDSEERAAEARASAEMIQVLGHELLNGLVPIVSLAECGIAAAEARDDDPALLPEILNTLARRAEALRRFTEAYRALARLPSPLKRPVSVAELADDLARLFASRWPAIGLAVDVEPGLSACCDSDQMNQALWAVLQNAAEAVAGVPAGSARVGLSARRDEAGLVIDVADNGPGVAPGQVHGIFRPFHTTKATGSGVGLSLARQIALAHGGTLTLVSASPAAFRFMLPATAHHA